MSASVLCRRHCDAIARVFALEALAFRLRSHTCPKGSSSGPLAIKFDPFQSADNWQAVVTGMVLVAAMAIQNAAHRIYVGSAPPSTPMTGTTTQIMIDLADVFLLGGKGRRSKTRLTRMSVNVLVFVAGCAAAALLLM